MFDLVVHNARLYPCAGGAELATETSFAVTGERVAELGVAADAPARERLDAQGAIVLPGLVDCHTHLCFAGDRMGEHAERRAGVRYADIAARGGGIAATVAAVHAADEDTLVEQSLPRLRALAREGVTTVEIKSGYGLSTKEELKQLRAIRRLRELGGIRVVPTFLALHTLPPEIPRERYVKQVVEETLPAVAAGNLAQCVDVFCDRIAFTVEEMITVFMRARELGFRCRAHTDQLANIGATRAAAQFGVLSCDHLEYAESKDVKALARSRTVAVLLPGAYYFLRENHPPPVEQLRSARVAMAVATDLNPGTSPLASPLAAIHLACMFLHLRPAEAVLGFTRHAAAALGLGDEIGTLAPGMRADFALWDISSPEFFAYQLGGIEPRAVYFGGKRRDA